jgi:hypothetical protein
VNVGYTYGRDYNVALTANGDGHGPLYGNWDKDSTTMCVCDTGFTGPDCSYRICPKGDDPMTTPQNYRQIILTTGATSGFLTGFWKFGFLGETIRISANASNYTAVQCDQDFESLPNVEEVTCTRTPQNNGNLGANYTITFKRFPVLPHENNIFSHSGNPALLDFSCDASELTTAGGAVGAFCKVVDSVATSV